MRCPRCHTEAVNVATHCSRCGQAVIPPVPPPPLAAEVRWQQLQYPPAPHGERIGALLLDGLFCFLLAMPGMIVLLALVFRIMPSENEGHAGRLAAFGVVLTPYFVASVPSMLCSFLKDRLGGGAGWGKRICGLRVVHVLTGRPCTLGRSFLWQVTYFAGVYGILTVADIVMVFTRPDRRRLGPLVAGTMVMPAMTSGRQAPSCQPWYAPSQSGLASTPVGMAGHGQTVSRHTGQLQPDEALQHGPSPHR